MRTSKRYTTAANADWCEKGTTMRKAAAVGVLLGAVLVGGTGLAACGGSSADGKTSSSATRCQTGHPTVTVQGYSTVEGPPDTLTISLGVQTQAVTAVGALNANSAKAGALVALLKGDGVATKNFQTTGLSIQPVYVGAKNRLVGYQVTNTLTVTIRALGLAGKIIDDAAKAVGNSVRVDDIAFSLQDDSVLLDEARTQAVRQAVGQARGMASAAGMTLGPLCSLNDSTSEPTAQPVYEGLAAGAAPVAQVPVEAGSVQVSGDVTAVYQLNSAK
jgi:hypothetical protein